MNIHSLKGQIVFILAGFTLILAIQLLASRNNLDAYSLKLSGMVESYNDVTLVYELERDVIDLQRTLLIYKETISESTANHFYTVMTKVNKNLTILKNSHSMDETTNQLQESLDRMSNHLNDYSVNFEKVSDTRKKHIDLLNNSIYPLIKDINDAIATDIKGKVTPEERQRIARLFANSEIVINKYLNQYNYQSSNLIKKELGKVNAILVKKPDLAELKSKIETLESQFKKLVNLTRGYTFLVNVVMAGNANEFLFLAKQVKEETIAYNTKVINESRKSEATLKRNNDIMGVIFILLCLFIFWIIIYRLINPIEKLTKVFKELSEGKEIEKIPGTDRKDEFGSLSIAASVFQEKNRQTQELLKSTQDMVEIQERLNQQMEIEKEKAEKAADTKSLFLANMSHEIRTPMNGIIGLVDMLRRTDITHKQKSYLERIAYSGKVMMNVINDILDFSKIEAGKMDIERIPYQVDSVIDNILSSITAKANEKGLSIELDISQQVPDTLVGDPLRISQILLNLCNNAIKFTDTGGITIHLDYLRKDGQPFFLMRVSDTGIGMSPEQLNKVFSSFSQADDSTSRKFGGTGLGLAIIKRLTELMNGHIEVDTELGQGSEFSIFIRCDAHTDLPLLKQVDVEHVHIPTLIINDCPLLASPILQAANLPIKPLNPDQLADTQKDIPSLLVVCNCLDELLPFEALFEAYLNHGGDLNFIIHRHDSETYRFINKRWNTGVLLYPCSPGNVIEFFTQHFGDAHSANEADASEQTSIQFDGMLLLVEDNKINQLVAGDMLESMGITFDIAENGQQAFDTISAAPAKYDLVLMDVQMPVMDGYTATQKIRHAGIDSLKICGLSANAMREDKEKAMQSGMNDYITKPLQWDDLRNLLSKYLRIKEQN